VRPSALVPCGHVYCEECLLRVFTTPTPDELPETPHWDRPKYCPDCRSPVQFPPVHIHLAKSIIRKIHPEIEHSTLSRFGLPAGFEDCQTNHWDRIFPPSFDFDGIDTESDGVMDGYRSILDGISEQDASDSAGEIEGYLPVHDHYGRLASARLRRIDDRMLLESQDGLNQLSLDLSAGVMRPRRVNTESRRMRIEPNGPGSRPVPIIISDDENDESSGETASLMDEDMSDDASIQQDVRSALFEGYRARHSHEDGPGTFYEAVRSEPVNAVADNDAWTPYIRRLAARGVHPAMQRVHNIKYSHSQGIYIEQPPNLILYVGWNVTLLPGDENGDSYVSYLRWELEHHPERWKDTYFSRVRKAYRLTWEPTAVPHRARRRP
jgi:hypothetical protein